MPDHRYSGRLPSGFTGASRTPPSQGNGSSTPRLNAPPLGSGRPNPLLLPATGPTQTPLPSGSSGVVTQSGAQASSSREYGSSQTNTPLRSYRYYSNEAPIVTAYNHVTKLLREGTKTLRLDDVVEAIKYLCSQKSMPQYERGILADVASCQAQFGYGTAFTRAVDHLQKLLADRWRTGVITVEALKKVAELLSRNLGGGTAKQDPYTYAHSQSSHHSRTAGFGGTGYASRRSHQYTRGTGGHPPPRSARTFAYGTPPTSGNTGGVPPNYSHRAKDKQEPPKASTSFASSEARTTAATAGEPIEADHNKFLFVVQDDFNEIYGKPEYNTSNLQVTREAIIAYRMAKIDYVKAEKRRALKPGEEKEAMEKAMTLTVDDIKWLRTQFQGGPDT